MAAKVFLFVFIAGALAIGGEFRTLLNVSESVTLSMPRPADMILEAKTLEIKLGPSQAPPNRIMQLQQRIQADLARQFEITNKKSDAELQFSVISYEPITIKNQTVMENRTINVGNDKKADYETRSVPVVYELIHGSATISINVLNASGSALDSFKQEEIVARRRELTVNGKASSQTDQQSTAEESKARPKSLGGVMTLPTGWPHPNKPQKQAEPVVETADSIEQGMLQKLAEKVAHRYVSSTQKVDIALAMDSELRQGNKLAQSGQWTEALDSWTKASMKKNPSDRLYNMAVAGEALAYVQFTKDNDMGALIQKFQQSMNLYTQALHGDPDEKYMRESVDRIQLAKSNIETARRLQVQQDLAADEAAKTASDISRQRNMQEAAVSDHRADTPTEATFRRSVRTQLSEVKGSIPDSQRERLLAFGGRLKLSEIESYRVVMQEVKRHSDVTQALQDYEDTFRPMAADGKITVAERAQLKDLAKQEGLESDEVKTVEAKYHFTEESPRPSRTGSGNFSN